MPGTEARRVGLAGQYVVAERADQNVVAAAAFEDIVPVTAGQPIRIAGARDVGEMGDAESSGRVRH